MLVSAQMYYYRAGALPAKAAPLAAERPTPLNFPCPERSVPLVPCYRNWSRSAFASSNSGSSCNARFTKMMARARSFDLWAMRAWRR